MTAAEERDPPDADLDRLRRRLYRADATPRDLQRYLAEREAARPAEPVPPAPAHRHRGPLLGALAVAVALVAGVSATGALLHRPAAPPRVAGSSAPSRVAGPTLTAVPIDGTATAAERFEGVGNGVLSIHLPGAEFGTLRAVVLVYSSRTSTISWTAVRPPSGDVAVVARARLTSHVDVATPEAFTYAGAPPTRITVGAPPGLHWTMLVAAADGSSADLR